MKAMLKSTALFTVTGLMLAAGPARAGCGMGVIGAAGAKPTIHPDDGSSGLLKSGYLVDAGFVAWHDDGTELMNSGRAPASVPRSWAGKHRSHGSRGPEADPRLRAQA